jgi:Ca-activated chloride channel homolog
MSSKRSSGRPHRRRNAFLGIGGLLLATAICFSVTVGSAVWLIGSLTGNNDDQPAIAGPSWPLDSAELTVAVSPLMEPVLSDLAEDFNALSLQTPDGKKMSVKLVALAPEKIVEQSLAGPSFQAISPDSSLWIDQLEQQWESATSENLDESAIPIGRRRTSGQIRYAVSPIVIIAWESVARELGWPDQPIGWQDIQRRATIDPDFKWNHAGTNTASGLLATLAEFYAGANLVRGLTEEIATAQDTLDYVQSVESTIRFYGEGEEVIIERLAAEGRDFLDAFVGQERVVINWNAQQPGERLVAIYPAEGSLWTDHPLALLELGDLPEDLPVTDNQRLTYSAFADFLISADVQQRILASGYRPTDLSIPLDSPGSPFASDDAVNWREPQTTLQIPSPSVIDVVRDAWRYTKRPTNVYLVVDTSGSMDGTKIDRTREALTAFVNQVQGDRDQVGIVEFASNVKSFTPLRVLDDSSRRDMLAVIGRMNATGGTALIDAVHAAIVDLRAQADEEAINAVVVMTDGLDNESSRSLGDLQALLADREAGRIIIFTIAFGDDADEWLLNEMARSGSGQFRRADETDIEELYRIVSTYF